MLLIIFNIVLAIIVIIFTALAVVIIQNDEALDTAEKNISLIFDCIVVYIAIATIVNQIQLM